MRIRDAVEADSEAIAAATGRPRSVVIDTIHDRSVRVAVAEPKGEQLKSDGESSESDGESSESNDDRRGQHDSPKEVENGGGGDRVIGFVAFDARGNTVHVSDFDGDDGVVRRLLEFPRRFAAREKMALEVVVPNDHDRQALSEMGFEAIGSGPRFRGKETTRYRIEADDVDIDTK
ncbi:hypothetical protein [Halorubrum sp. BV1]|uniref:hypothetical protein n=1 Tax=Halorubrum sp. BV1 TaxID=1498500 RepID=UPI0006790D53|nr:hypothetical protein [Halorubrum sp. BV1]